MKKALFTVPLLLLLLLCSACPVRPSIDVNGIWERGSKASIWIKGNKGYVKGENGAVIPVKIEYQANGTARIYESKHSPDFLQNYIPLEVAKLIFTNSVVNGTYYIITEDTNGNISAEIHAWEVFYDHDFRPYYVIPKTFTEEWGTKKEKK